MTAIKFVLQIIPERVRALALSSQQKTFNQLIKKIQLERRNLEAWNAVMSRYQQKYMAELQPLLDQVRVQKIEWLRQMDQAYLQYQFTKQEKRKLSLAICRVAEDLMNSAMQDELKEIYNRHSPEDYDDEVQEELAIMKAMFEKDFHYKFGDDETFESSEDMVEFMRRRAKSLADEALAASDAAHANKKKSAKDLVQEDAEVAMQRSVRDVFRKLAQDLHPDREQDLVERERKNELMQRVNVAYKAKDLLALLELQIEVAQIDASALRAMNDERLQGYNKVLREQLATLKQQIDRLSVPFTLSGKLPLNAKGSPEKVMGLLRHEIAHMKRVQSAVKSDLHAFKSVDYIKDWLKTLD